MMLVDLRENRGTEQVFFNLIKYKPEDVQVGVVIPNISFYKRIESKDLENRLKDVVIMSAALPQNYYSRPKIIWPLHQFLSDRKYIKLNDALRSKLKEFDLIYLFYNRHSILFDRKTHILVGSEHTMRVTGLFAGNLAKRISSFLLNRKYFDKLTAIHIFPSEEPYKEQITKYLGISRVFSLPNGIDLDLFKPGSKKDFRLGEHIKVFFVASLEFSKGFDIFLEVATMMSEHHNMEFHVVGSGPMAKNIESLSNVTYHKSITDQELAKLYRDMDIFVYPTRADSFALVVLQALASGLLVLTSKSLAGIYKEFNSTSIKFLDNNPSEYVSILTDLAENPDKFNLDKNECFELIKLNYDWEQIASQFYKEIKSIHSSKFISYVTENNDLKES